MFRMLKLYLFDLFFPPRCAACDKIGDFICSECLDEILIIKQQTCPKCERITLKGKYCPRCRQKLSLGGVVSLGYFKDENLKKIIHEIKYRGYFAVCEKLAELLCATVLNQDIKFDQIAFVPSSKKKLARRGYNQSEILAKEMARILKKPLVKDLEKIRNTKAQVGLRKKQRALNLIGSFEYVGEPLTGQRVLLVDDVVTTGATLNECARALKKAGARQIWGATVAKE